MRLKAGTVIWLLGMVLYFAPATPLLAQVITVGPDSTLVPTVEAAEPIPILYDSINEKKWFFLSEWDKPAKAALFSAVVPGAGQFYNKAYWKVPIVYATGAVLGFFLIDNNNKYQDFRVALLQRKRNEVDKYVDHQVYGKQKQNGTINLEGSRDFYRRNRDLTVILSVAAWGLQVAEAYVHAHMKDFDVSDDLALRMEPSLLPVTSQPGSVTPAFTLTLYTRSK
ncbi:DUF5683 domain-containing protein [Pontibacter akesuensis]|uniref:DUF5683 domain-containing protein n=1 Tax=Pontibacter akesuensis TaxID=388950 RepID=A0A1I7GAA8_9BACT|nr:DUF5683 domain-containing protein [Pontibacter akesuensis]GHA57839.1 hypothetical protein GCM10007389_07110 [Pontibacter akesuensis]SFU45281.1 hypothetical protein SAMN04487941_0856 [Pontibacter akesuensis]